MKVLHGRPSAIEAAVLARKSRVTPMAIGQPTNFYDGIDRLNYVDAEICFVKGTEVKEEPLINKILVQQ